MLKRVIQGINSHPTGKLLLSTLAVIGVFGLSGTFSILMLEIFPSKSQPPLFQALHIYESRKPNETMGEFYFMLGTQMAARGQILSAEDLLSKAVKLMPNHSDAWMNYGVVLEALDRNQDALEAYTQAAKTEPVPPQTLYTLGLLYDKLGMTDKGVESLHKAYNLDPRNNLIAYDLGVLYSKQENYEKSALYTKKALEGATDFAEAHNNYAYALAHLRQYDEALEAANKSLELKPDSAAALDTRGFIYQGMSRYEEALTDYKQAISLDPTIGEIYQHMAETYEKLGERDKAVQAYETYLSLTPNASNSTEIQRRISELKKPGGFGQKSPINQAKNDQKG